MALQAVYSQETVKRSYLPIKDTSGLDIIALEGLELIANFSFVPQTQEIIKSKLAQYQIDTNEFCVFFDGATFEYYPKQLKVTVFIYEYYYSFEFTKPQHLGQPVSKNTEAILLGHSPK